MHAIIENLIKVQELEQQTRRKVPDKDQMIAELRQSIHPSILAHYDRLRARGRKGVSIVRNRVCAECHMHVPIGVLATLMQGKDIQLCSNCGRYLHLPAETPPESPPVAESAKPSRRKKKRAEAAEPG